MTCWVWFKIDSCVFDELELGIMTYGRYLVRTDLLYPSSGQICSAPPQTMTFTAALKAGTRNFSTLHMQLPHTIHQ